MRKLFLISILSALLVLVSACAPAPLPAAPQPSSQTSIPEVAAPVSVQTGAETPVSDMPEDACCKGESCPYAEECEAQGEGCPYAGECEAQGEGCPYVGECGMSEDSALCETDACPHAASFAQNAQIVTDKSCPAALGDACALANGLVPALPATCCDEPAPEPQYHKLTAEQAKANLSSGTPHVLLDVRTKEEYEQRHIPGALLLPNEEIGTQPPALLPDKDATILLYCRSGRRSKEAAEKLVAMGYTQVFDFGGINDWPYETTADA